MENEKLINKLIEKTKVSYYDAENALRNSNWDILDAVVYLENNNILSKPSVSIFYSNQYNPSYEERNIQKSDVNEYENTQSKENKKNSQGVFLKICNAIDICNNIFIEVKKRDKVFLKMPLTVIIALFIFGFWLFIPLMIVGLFFEITFFVSSKKIDEDKIKKVNEVFNKLANKAEDIKKKFNKGV